MIFIVVLFCLVWSTLIVIFLEAGLFLVLYFEACLSLVWDTCIMPAGLTPKQICWNVYYPHRSILQQVIIWDLQSSLFPPFTNFHALNINHELGLQNLSSCPVLTGGKGGDKPRCLDWYIFLRRTSFLSSGLHHPMTKQEQAKWAQICNRLGMNVYKSGLLLLGIFGVFLRLEDIL